jgi:HEAT repeat protein
MGLLDVFKRKSPIERAVADLREPYAQPDVRRAAMGKLLELATPEAYAALLVRFTFNASGHIADESEKRDLVDELANVGEPAVESIKQFVQREKAVAFPIEALSRILPREAVVAFLVETLGQMEPSDHRTVEQKRAIVQALSDLGGPAEAPLAARYLADLNDDVKAVAVATVTKLANPESYGALVAVCTGDEAAARIQRLAAEALATLEADVKDAYAGFNGELKQDWVLAGGKLVKKS